MTIHNNLLNINIKIERNSKHITYDKTNHNYKLTLKQKTISNHKKLTHALQEKQLQLTRQEQDEETLCHTNNTKTTTLPPTPWNNPLHNMKKDHQKYLTQHQTYHNNPDTITHIQQNQVPRQTILNMQKPDRNIRKEYKTYLIIKTTNKKRRAKICHVKLSLRTNLAHKESK